MGFKEASGKIMAVTDDQILWPDGLLKNSKHLAPALLSNELLIDHCRYSWLCLLPYIR